MVTYEPQQNIPLTPYNTLGVSVKARYFSKIDSLDKLNQALEFSHQLRLPLLVLGEGSNTVLTQDFPGLVLLMANKGVTFSDQSSNEVVVSAQAGENWSGLVSECLRRNLYGLENLSFIPGSVGAAPMQNIGAYGVELKDVFHSLQAIDRHTLRARTFDAMACRFGYRDSVFKRDYKHRYIITSVSLVLARSAAINIEYPSLHQELDKSGLDRRYITPHIVSKKVTQIRQNRLPDPKLLKNVGSFFKNPKVSYHQWQQLKLHYPNIPYQQEAGGRIKLNAAYLIEYCGWKGIKLSGVGVYDQHSLILVNYGQASGRDIIALATRIQQSVKATFAIDLEIEPDVY